MSFWLALMSVPLLTVACSKSDDASKSEAKSETKVEAKADAKPEAKSESKPLAFDASKLPRMPGAKEVFASAANTIFTSAEPVAQTADALQKALTAAGWQSYVAPRSAQASDPNMRIMSLKKGAQGLSVFISVAPAQNNATSVNYSGVELKNDLPFPKDAAAIEYRPEDRPLLLLSTAEPVDRTLEFYRKELAPRGWLMWSQRRNALAPEGGAAGEPTKNGASAYYLRDNTRLAILELERDGAATKVKFEELPASRLAELRESYVRSDNGGVAQADVGALPRLDGATVNAARTTPTNMQYSVVGSVKDTVAATVKLLEADGWTQFVAPLDPQDTLRYFKKDRYAVSVSFTQTAGQPGQSSVYYTPSWLVYALALPADAADVVYDTNRPYLSAATAMTPEATLAFYRKALDESGWTSLAAADIAAQWPEAKASMPDESAPGTRVYFARGKQRPILLSVTPRGDAKTAIEIRVASFAEPQVALDGDIFGLPKPKPIKSAGGTGGDVQHTLHATVPVRRDAVLEFYRAELAKRGWKEDAQGVVSGPDQVTLNFVSPEGPAVLKLGYRYDLTTVSLVQQLPKPVATKSDPVARSSDMLADAMKDMQQMMRDMNVAPGAAAPQSAPKGPEAPLQKLAGNTAPLPVPDTAEDVEFDAGEGKLEFSSASSPKTVADFYRSAMKEQGWDSRPSVINNPNMVVLNFAKAGKPVAFTIMRMGNKTNVSAEGAALKSATASAGAKAGAAVAAVASPPASADDLVAEEFGGLPAPKRRTMTEGTQTPFRRDLTASIPLSVEDVLGFYRRELAKLNWKEETSGAVVTPDNVVIAYATGDGPALLKLGRKDGETSVSLVAKNPGAVAKDGVLPKSGQARILFGNINDAAATVTFNNKPVNVAAGAGTKKPDGPTLDIAPGKYKYSIRLPGKPAQSEELVIGADETWGLMVGPGGVLALQAY